VIVGTLFVAFLALTLAASGFAKWSSPRYFRAQVESHEILPRSLRRTASTTVPAAEAALGLLLFSGLLWPLSAILALGLIAAFCGYRLVAIQRKVSGNCGCSGIGVKENLNDPAGLTAILVQAGILLVIILSGVSQHPSVIRLSGTAVVGAILIALTVYQRQKWASYWRARELSERLLQQTAGYQRIGHDRTSHAA
jgi:hypothetical protein